MKIKAEHSSAALRTTCDRTVGTMCWRRPWLAAGKDYLHRGAGWNSLTTFRDIGCTT